jgi:hypothetical protein
MNNYSIRYTAGEDLEQGLFVENSSGDVIAVDTAGALSLGVTLHAALSGEGVGVANDGIVEVQGAVALTPGQYVSADANGRAVVSTSTDLVLGRVVKGCEAGDGSGNFDRALITLTDYQIALP